MKNANFPKTHYYENDSVYIGTWSPVTDVLANFGCALVKTVMLLCVRRETKLCGCPSICVSGGWRFIMDKFHLLHGSFLIKSPRVGCISVLGTRRPTVIAFELI
ncbi:Vwfa And Cache Domain-Containing Protein 1 [Manis pentadactyla]|nr:Vwfa And Cache Domain-Containing Protein 1 [Manis pentadactyla]